MLPEERVDLILKYGAKEICDDSNPIFRNAEQIPESFDEEKFKRGQAFYHKYIYAMFLGKFVGLVTLLAIPSVLDILTFTKMSSEPLTAYKRYLGTVFHMKCWYDEEFKPGSKTWKSLGMVRRMHNAASKKAKATKGNFITEKDMALTQFGFMGYIVACPKLIGIHDEDKEGFESFIYVWKTIGQIMGIDEKYNICRDSLEETRAICLKIIEKVFIPYHRKQDERFYPMADALISGMWAMNPMLDTKPMLNYLYFLLNSNTEKEERIPLMELNRTESFKIWLLNYWIWLLQLRVWRGFANLLQYITFWLMEHFPFLAYYKYGYKHSHIDIYVQESRKTG